MMKTNELIEVLEWLEIECGVMVAALRATGEDDAKAAYDQLDYADCLQVYEQIYAPGLHADGVPDEKVRWMNNRRGKCGFLVWFWGRVMGARSAAEKKSEHANSILKSPMWDELREDE